MDDLELIIHEAKQGNRNAFEKIYKLYYQRIYRYCRINITIDELADDICQETFIRAWKALSSFTLKNGGTLQAFLFRIARHLLIDLSRKKKEFSLAEYAEIETNEDHIEQIAKQDE